MDRHWYSRNKHIYPASRWAVFDEAREFGNGKQGGEAAEGSAPGK